MIELNRWVTYSQQLTKLTSVQGTYTTAKHQDTDKCLQIFFNA